MTDRELEDLLTPILFDPSLTTEQLQMMLADIAVRWMTEEGLDGVDINIVFDRWNSVMANLVKQRDRRH